MASLEEELLNDFGDLSGDEEAPDADLGDEEQELAEQLNGEDKDTDERMDDGEGTQPVADGAKPSSSSTELKSATALLKKLEPVIEDIDRFQSTPSSTFIGSLEENPEFRLLGEANTLSVSIDNELTGVHKYIRDHYSVRFPELETLVTNPVDYCKTVAIIGNGPMSNIKSISTSTSNMANQALNTVLSGPSLMVVNLEAATTQGQPLPEKTLSKVMHACSMALTMERSRSKLTSYVQSRLSIFAPNLTALVGSLTAAQLLNYAGGLSGLAKTPACNIAPLGNKRQSGLGFATNVGIRQQGFLYSSAIIQSIQSDMKKQALRIVSAKVVLAARIDLHHESPSGTAGQEMHDKCLLQLEKLAEPANAKGPRALPAPDDKPSRKRGGRRARKAKEALAQTDLAKARNRMAFGKEEAEIGYGTGDNTVGLGMIGQSNDGRIRAQQIDQRTKAKLSKKNPGWGGGISTNTPGFTSSIRGLGAGGPAVHGLRTSGVGVSGNATGTASTIAFTAVQGLELVDPRQREEQTRKRKAEEDRWFKGGTFSQVGGTGTGNATARVDAGGFKIPSLPPPTAKKPKMS